MKIWVIGRHYPAVNNRMRGSFELEQAKMLARRGHDVTYIAVVFHPYKKIREWGFTTWKEDGITICGCSRFFFPEKMKIEMPRFRALSWKQALDRAEKVSGRPDIIHVHYPAMITDPEAVLSRRLKGSAVFCTEHWTAVLAKTIGTREKKRLEAYANNADGFICVGEPLRKAVLELTQTGKEITVIPNVVNPVFRPEAKKTERPYFEFVTAGRLVRVKQIDQVIRAFSRLRKENRDVRLTVLGDGEEKEKLANLAEELKAGDAVTFTGTLPREKAAERIAHADCLICYSNLETFGVPIIEAWACGIPAIASDALGFAEYWKPGLGYIVDQNRTDELYEKMKDVMDGRDAFDPVKIRAFAQEHFSEEAVGGKIEKLYANALHPEQPAIL